MRSISLALAPLLAVASIAPVPAAAQVSATIHIGPIRLGGGADHYQRGYPPRVVVVDYPSRNYGHWKKTAKYWRPITVYYLDGYYFERPYRHARPVVIYRYHDHYFAGPRDRDWDRYRVRYERDNWYQYRDNRGQWRDDWRSDRRDDRYDRRDDRRDDRYDRRDDRRDDRYERRDDRRDDRYDRRDDRRDDRVGRGNGARPSVVAPRTAAPRGQAESSNRSRRRNGS